MIKVALSSVAQTAIMPMQDILRLGSSARMNIPATQVNDTFTQILFSFWGNAVWAVEWCFPVFSVCCTMLIRAKCR